MRKLFLLFISILAFHFLSAQDEAIFMQYHISPVLINPAAAGFDDSHNLHLNLRAQWTGFPDAPKTYTAYYNGPIGKSFGLGVGLLSETAAQLTRLKAQLNFAFKFNIQETAKLSAGFFTEFQQMTVDNAITGGEFFDPADDLLTEILDGKSIFDAALGVRGTIKENTYFGITFNNLVRSRLDDIAGTTSSGNRGFFSYYTFNLGHTFELYEYNVKLEPSILIRQIRDVPFQMDFNLKASFLKDQLIAGVSYRSLSAMGILLGTKLSAFRLYYSYDLSFQHFQKFNTGSHEVTVAFKFEKKEKDLKKF
ncbi:MAG: PorP/SprF family type IX secretion system membrane protein [Saprospiraceae bacterium]|nr:PorP/SprF family type IX secretion system membrane protein [Saprospiraceae bacterium]MCB9323968.1 PorP/SprF family type IX secretion system membrane protein [Lewinellaceae bacterium]